MRKRIALFGGTGRTGTLFLDRALAAGYQVKALVRSPQKVTQQHDNLTIVEGDVLDPLTVDKAITDTDVVVSLFGHVKNSPEWLQTNGTKNIVAAMKNEGVKKIVSLSGGGLPFPEKDEPKFMDKLIRGAMKLFAAKILTDAIEHHGVLSNSGLDWIIVRGPRLTNGEEKGTYRTGWVGVNSGTSISRADLSDFLLKQVEDDTYLSQMPFVSY